MSARRIYHDLRVLYVIWGGQFRATVASAVSPLWGNWLLLCEAFQNHPRSMLKCSKHESFSTERLSGESDRWICWLISPRFWLEFCCFDPFCYELSFRAKQNFFLLFFVAENKSIFWDFSRHISPNFTIKCFSTIQSLFLSALVITRTLRDYLITENRNLSLRLCLFSLFWTELGFGLRCYSSATQMLLEWSFVPRLLLVAHWLHSHAITLACTTYVMDLCFRRNLTKLELLAYPNHPTFHLPPHFDPLNPSLAAQGWIHSNRLANPWMKNLSIHFPLLITWT